MSIEGLFAGSDEVNRIDFRRALVRRIVEESGGSVWVESAGRDQGSAFYFTLPAAG